MEPKQRLSGASQFFDLVEDERDRFLHAPIRVLLVTDGERALTQEIEFILVEAALQSEQETVVALPGGAVANDVEIWVGDISGG